jgi:tetratricopeptide (TPR) repeat protein
MIRGTRQKQSRRISSKKKVSPAKRATRQSGGVSRRGFSHSAAAPAKSRARGKASPHPPVKTPVDIERQAILKNFEAAVRLFQKRDYAKALPLFEKVAAGSIREFADRARVHLRFCKSKQKHESRPKTAEGCYARGVAALNSGDFDQAVQYLSKSDKMIPDQEYVHYALAAAYGRQGDQDHALSHLETAIRLRPQNRIQARQDEDFQDLSGDPRFARLLVPVARQPLS